MVKLSYRCNNYWFWCHFQRPLWRHYYQNTDVLIFVIDSNDRERMPECHDELWRFFGEEELKNCFVLVLANKQDLPNAMSVEEITEQLKLNSMKDRAWRKFILTVNQNEPYVLMVIHVYVLCNFTTVLFFLSSDIQGTCATNGDGLYEGLTWLQTELTGKQIKKAVTKPIQETSDSVVKSGFFSSWFSSLSSYFAFTSTSVSDS